MALEDIVPLISSALPSAYTPFEIPIAYPVYDVILPVALIAVPAYTVTLFTYIPAPVPSDTVWF